MASMAKKVLGSLLRVARWRTGDGAVVPVPMRVIVAGVAAALAVGCTPPSDDVPQPDLPEVAHDPEVRRRVTGSAEAVAADDALAKAHGAEVQDPEARAAFERVVAQIRRHRPDIFAGATAADPMTVYIKGRADRFVRKVIDAAPSGSVSLVEGMRYSKRELDEQADRLVDALHELGYREFVVASLETRGRLATTVRRRAGLPTSPADLRAALPDDIAGHTRIDLVDHAVGEDFRRVRRD